MTCDAMATSYHPSGPRPCHGLKGRAAVHISSHQRRRGVHFCQMSKLFKGIKTSFFLAAGFVEGSLYRARIHLSGSKSTPSASRLLRSWSRRCWAISPVATPLKTTAAKKPPSSSRVVMLSDRGSGICCPESCAKTRRQYPGCGTATV
jgi:hypothetical protein